MKLQPAYKGIKVGSLRSFLKELIDKEVMRLKNIDDYEYFYRGHASHTFKVLPTIYRQGGFIASEDKIFQEIIMRKPDDFINDKSTIDKLVKMQHYGMPTRILDITTNPLVALYFACEPLAKNSKDGEVIIFKIPKKEKVIKYSDSDTVSVLANLSQMPKDFTSNHGLLLHKIRDEKPQFNVQYKVSTFNKVIAVKAKLSNNRILRQHGAFLLFGFKGKKEIPPQIPESWILRIKIRNRQKTQILHQLKALTAITESTLYPELDKQAQDIKKLYA